jgi:ABC-type Fe3+/spermidine/putrescine transport system ATPase subunit
MQSAMAAPVGADARAPWKSLQFQGVGKVFLDSRGTHYPAARDITISIGRGDFYCLLGPSGCGKSTLLGMVAGFEPPTSGRIFFVGDDAGRESITPVVAAGIDRSMIFQDASEALFPWLDVEENVLFGPRLRSARARDCKRNVGKYLTMVGLQDHAH